MSPGQEEKIPALMAVSDVDLTGKYAAEWWYQTRAFTLGRSYALSAESVASFVSGWVGGSMEGLCLSEKRQSFYHM